MPSSTPFVSSLCRTVELPESPLEARAIAFEVEVVRENVPIQRADWGLVGRGSGWKWPGPTGEVGGPTWMGIEVLMVVLLTTPLNSRPGDVLG